MIPIEDPSFQKIVCFYLFECPARFYHRDGKDENGKPIYSFSRVSHLGRTLSERGIEGGKVNSLRAAMLRVAGKHFSFAADPNLTVPDAEEYIVIKRTEFKTEGIFYFIRNALAHGEFVLSNGYYILENHKNTKLMGKAKVHQDTLLKWIELVEMPIEKIKEAGKGNL